jgi:anti-sigma factor RsiW
MNCRKVTNLISAYIDGELTGTEMLAIRRHLSECADCAQEYESMRSLKEAMSRLRTVMPRKDFVADIFTKVQEQHVPRQRMFSTWLSKLASTNLSPVTAALAVFGAALVLLTAGGMEGFNSDLSRTQSAFLPQSNEVAFLREISVPQIGFDLDKPLVVANIDKPSGPELQFASFSR